MLKTIEDEYYQALIEKNPEYNGIFYVGVKTTGVFCHPICPARKPKFENCVFYKTTQQALEDGFRPCKRCSPLSTPNRMPEIVQQLIDAVDAQPKKKWRNEDVKALHIDPSTARRQFKKRFGMTFIEYARARCLELAMQHIQDGTSVIDAQVSAGYESGSGFRDAFERIIGESPSASKQHEVLKATWIDTPLGTMIAIACDKYLRLLEFVDMRDLDQRVEKLRQQTQRAIIPGCTDLIDNIEQELDLYFSGKLKCFKTPTILDGTPFQVLVWKTLKEIPFGQTCSYTDIAVSIGKPKTVRAVAQANANNRLAIVIPCHRVINSNGKLAGYAGGIARKKWLIDHEQEGS